eukprot:CAMPEP_0196591640 /NCGR_PEP_ID=MMETSP1081-20130531/70395_1 /TAXON_ID=36882 /ORGANISM="Pyramimonas amylifera, Strain CCMP720" /LENGTH=211 /DNA_ID=CAMNT_0041915063 /DNA_START=95 /DNA_END=730 /DNA_ORIENTATION=-
MKFKHLQSLIQDLEHFRKPRMELEQYPTAAELATCMMFTSKETGDIEDKVVVDLGCGCGTLAISAILLGASYVIGVEIDSGAIEVALENCEGFEDLYLDMIQCNLANIAGLRLKADTVVMNPPFGTKTEGADMEFLKCAFQVAETAVYSLHKRSTREYIRKFAMTKLKAVSAKVVAEMQYELPISYKKLHKLKSVDIEVDMWRFEVPKSAN